MATRLDERTGLDIGLDGGLDGLESTGLALHRPALPRIDPSTRLEVPTRGLIRAMAAWLVGVYVLCWVALPLASVLLFGVHLNLLASGVVGLPVFALASLVAVCGAGVLRPRMALAASAPRGPVASAFAGGFLAWALIHNLAPFLQPFARMSALEVGLLVGINLVEMALMGAMLGSLVPRRRDAFALGAGFQLLLAGLLGVVIAI